MKVYTSHLTYSSTDPNRGLPWQGKLASPSTPPDARKPKDWRCSSQTCFLKQYKLSALHSFVFCYYQLNRLVQLYVRVDERIAHMPPIIVARSLTLALRGSDNLIARRRRSPKGIRVATETVSTSCSTHVCTYSKSTVCVNPPTRVRRIGFVVGITLYDAVIRGCISVVDYLLTVTVIDGPQSKDLLSAAAFAPSKVRSGMISMLENCFARAESTGRLQVGLRPTKRTRYS